MTRASAIARAIVVVAAPLALSACAQGADPQVTALQNDVAQLRAEVQRTQEMAAANQQATQLAQEQAARARQEALAASQRAETMYNRSLRK